MPKKLYLIRHSYASFSSETGDFGRPLTMQGASMARALGRYLHSIPFTPKHIVCSTAKRTRETATHLIEELQLHEHIVSYKDVLYNASIRELLMEVNALDDTWDEVAIIGHNPAISYLGEYLSGKIIENVEPCSVIALIDESLKWGDLAKDSMRLDYLYHPAQNGL